MYIYISFSYLKSPCFNGGGGLQHTFFPLSKGQQQYTDLYIDIYIYKKDHKNIGVLSLCIAQK